TRCETYTKIIGSGIFTDGASGGQD
ncbi:hypothetical protein LCGC14_2758320, partial [marine sediment metagenome]